MLVHAAVAAHQTGDGGDIDNGPRALVGHDAAEDLAGEQGAGQIGVDEQAGVFGLALEQVGGAQPQAAAGVVDHHIDAALPLAHVLGELAEGGVVADVEGGVVHLTAIGLFEMLGCGLGTGFLARSNGQMATGVG